MKILVIGCGYLGCEVISSLTKNGNFITAATKSIKKLKSLNKNVQKSVIFNPKDDVGLLQLVKDNDVIIITLMIENPDDYENDYITIVRNLKKIASSISSLKTIIFTSNTTTYGDHKGKWVDEFSDLKPMTDEAHSLVDAEKILLSLKGINWNIVILRLAEIYGNKLEISKKIKNLSENTYPGSGQNYTNMVHVNDVIAAIKHILFHKLCGIYNLADDDHLTRKELYSMVCEKMGLPMIKWDTTHKGLYQGNRRVSNYKIKSTGFELLFSKRVIS
jgi:nucleoside-diphosphate-sugar epimerase